MNLTLLTRPFWVVWSPRSGAPKRRHESYELAELEALRLSARVPGQHFYVLACAGYAMQGPEVPTANQAARRAKDTAALAAKQAQGSAQAEGV